MRCAALTTHYASSQIMKIGIIGGSGLYDIEGIKNLREEKLSTPFGDPSDAYITGDLEGAEVVFLPRHGRGHRISPSEINYRANIWGMKKLGVGGILSVSACGSLREEMKPMDFVIVDQFVDRTRGRISTFFTGGIVAHVSFDEPVTPELAKVLMTACQDVGVTYHPKGTYVNMEGPQFSTKAESNLYRSWGMDVIGMTNMTEAKLAREAEIAYATLAAVTDYDCWHPDHESVTLEQVIKNLSMNVGNAKAVLKKAIPSAAKLGVCKANSALATAIVTRFDLIPEKVKKDLEIMIGKYVK